MRLPKSGKSESGTSEKQGPSMLTTEENTLTEELSSTGRMSGSTSASGEISPMMRSPSTGADSGPSSKLRPLGLKSTEDTTNTVSDETRFTRLTSDSAYSSGSNDGSRRPPPPRETDFSSESISDSAENTAQNTANQA